MPRITLIICLLLLLSACKRSETQYPTSLINNYVFFGAFEYMPHSKIIREQTITGSEHKILNTNPDGLLTLITSKESAKLLQLGGDDNIDELKMIINYQAAKTIITDGENNKLLPEFNMQFDSNNNISKLESLNLLMTWLASYDNKNRLIKVSHTTDSNFITETITVDYDKQQIQKITTKVDYNISDQQKLYSIQEKQFYYDEKHRLNKIIINNHREIDQSSEQTIECSFYDYNENGDWTKSYCLIPNQKYTYFTLREITY
ncbi:hypothetical protein [Gilliamella sp. wkB112]|uniref:hypothetical protein n=1 Tax=Gilliamella sp. wkB112 TaxID=3120257 RepID=UPI00080EC0F4|nr:hypothetical protein [Gilliamella apicola]OCG00821.1 hypothetical protein A9G12_03390 [Gilliamella apicola]